MAQILIVEDDEFFRKAIFDLLSKKGHNVFEAPNGRAAVEIISLQEFDMVLSDIQMPGMNGIELLEWSIKHRPVPFIIMTGFSTILETQSAYDLGAKEFISKPFKNAELIALVNTVLGIDDQAPPVDTNEYCRLSINEFVSGKKAEFDIYVKLSEAKYVKIAHKGEELFKERITTYKEKGVQYLYITKEGFTHLVGFNLNIAGMLQTNKKISQEKKINFLKYTGEVILAKAFIAGVDKEVFAEAQNFVGVTLNTLADSNEVVDILDMLKSHSDHVYTHSMGVALYSVMIAKKMGFESNQAFFKLSMAAMFHDIGKKEIDPKILEKSRIQLTVEEKKILDSHVLKGQEIILTLKGIPEDISDLVFEHHEDVIGLGYPLANKKKDHHPLSRIIQLANQFVNLAVPGPNTPGMSGEEAVNYLQARLSERFDEKAMGALKSIFKVN